MIEVNLISDAYKIRSEQVDKKSMLESQEGLNSFKNYRLSGWFHVTYIETNNVLPDADLGANYPSLVGSTL